MPSVDVAEQPIYPLAEAARMLHTSPQSVSRWRRGYSFPTARGKGHSAPLSTGSPDGLLSFNELLELAVVSAARRARIPMQGIRRAVVTANELYRVGRPLLSLQFQHNGRDLFVNELADEGNRRFVNLSRRGQVAWDYIEDVLKDLDYEDGRAVRWYPVGRDEPIVIDPRVSFGRPYVIRKGISTEAVLSRFRAREPLDEIADDLGLSNAEAEAALRFELPSAA